MTVKKKTADIKNRFANISKRRVYATAMVKGELLRATATIKLTGVDVKNYEKKKDKPLNWDSVFEDLGDPVVVKKFQKVVEKQLGVSFDKVQLAFITKLGNWVTGHHIKNGRKANGRARRIEWYDDKVTYLLDNYQDEIEPKGTKQLFAGEVFDIEKGRDGHKFETDDDGFRKLRGQKKKRAKGSSSKKETKPVIVDFGI